MEHFGKLLYSGPSISIHVIAILYVRSDLSFHENKDEDKKCGYNRCSHHPGRKGLLVTKRTDEPAPLVRGGD